MSDNRLNRQYGQAGQPTGIIGRLLGQIMSWHNQPDNEWTIELLDISQSENILEIGYGPGKAIQKVSTLYPECRIVGIDHSEEMLTAATRRNRAAIIAGVVELKKGSVEVLNFAEGIFDKAYSINCIYFWSDIVGGLRELYRVLKIGGKLAITVRDKKRAAYQPFTQKNLKEKLSQAGFSKVEVVSNDSPSHPLLCGIAIK